MGCGCRLIVGPISSIFDMTTFLIMWYFYECFNDNPDNVIAFQTAWFLESLMTQVGHPSPHFKMPFDCISDEMRKGLHAAA